MIKILIADDENLIREGIISILKRSLTADVTYLEADNGISALKICQEQFPQIVICDIRMPCCNGLEFIKKVKQNGNSPTFIIISGYADFEYAKSALKLGVKEYVLKPIQKQQFITMVNSYVDQIIKNSKAAHEEHNDYHTSKEAMKTIKRRLLLELLDRNDAKSAEKSRKELEGLGVCLQSNFALSCVIQYKIDKSNEDYIDAAVENILQEIFAQEKWPDTLLIEQYSPGQTVAIFECAESEILLNNIKPICVKAIQTIRKFLNIEIFIGVGDAVCGSAHLHESFVHACQSANCKLYGAAAHIQIYSKTSGDAKCEPICFDDLIQPLENINRTEILNRFAGLMKLSPTVQAMTVVEESYCNLVKAIHEQIMKYNYDNSQDLPQPLPFNCLWSFSQLTQEITKYIDQAKNIAGTTKFDVPNKKLIFDVLQYIEKNLENDINLNIVAEYFSHTPSYMSSLFKKGVGMGFNEYLTKMRIKKAKDMLINTNIPVNEISKICGYYNPKYFAVTFKKVLGKSPTNFRQDSVFQKSNL